MKNRLPPNKFKTTPKAKSTFSYLQFRGHEKARNQNYRVRMAFALRNARTKLLKTRKISKNSLLSLSLFS